MFSQIDRCLRSCANSVGLVFIIGFLNSTTLLAAEAVVSANELDSGNSPFSFTVYFSPETYFLRINDNPILNLVEAILVFSGVLLIVYALWLLQKPKQSKLSGPAFKLLNLNEEFPYIPLDDEIQTLEFLSKIKTNKKFRLSANLNRVTLTPHLNTFLLEDKNYKNALLINRRRSHRTILCNNDVLDVGEMILLYCNNDVPAGINQRRTSLDLQLTISGVKPKGPLQKGVPILTLAGSHQEIPLVRNMNTLGTSHFNDVIVVSNDVALRHAKIYKVGQSWKIQNLLNHETTTVNGRRIDQRFLQDGDEIAIGDIFFKFRISKVQMKHVRKPKTEVTKKFVKT